jgi:hypothetical protein
MKKTPILTVALMGSLGGTVNAQPLLGDGQVTAEYSCGRSEIPGRTTQPFTATLTLTIRDGVVTGSLEGQQTAERFVGRLDPDGKIAVSSEGQWKDDPSRRWSSRFSGSASALPSTLPGAMYTNAGVRFRECKLALREGARSGTSTAAGTGALPTAPEFDPRSRSQGAANPPMRAQESTQLMTERQLLDAARLGGLAHWADLNRSSNEAKQVTALVASILEQEYRAPIPDDGRQGGGCTHARTLIPTLLQKSTSHALTRMSNRGQVQSQVEDGSRELDSFEMLCRTGASRTDPSDASGRALRRLVSSYAAATREYAEAEQRRLADAKDARQRDAQAALAKEQAEVRARDDARATSSSWKVVQRGSGKVSYPCLSGVCLADDITQHVTNVQWSSLDGYFDRRKANPSTVAWLKKYSIGIPAGLLDRFALYIEADAFDAEFIRMIAKSRPTFCRDVALLGNFSSSSGFPTRVGIKFYPDGAFHVTHMNRGFPSDGPSQLNIQKDIAKQFGLFGESQIGQTQNTPWGGYASYFGKELVFSLSNSERGDVGLPSQPSCASVGSRSLN